MTMLGGVLIAGGGLLLAIAAWGVLVLPDALARQHAATKAGTLALALVCRHDGDGFQRRLDLASARSCCCSRSRT
jgi:hypothetical protein